MRSIFFLIVFGIDLMLLGLSGVDRPILAADDTFLEVTPNEILFTIAADGLAQNKPYYAADRPTRVTSSQRFLKCSLWSLGIRAAGTHLVDVFNPANRIPITQLRWSRDGVHFNSLSSQWTQVNAYWDEMDVKHTEMIDYRIYSEGAPLPPGTFSVQLIFDARLQKFPWNQ